jgi:pentatricopeptide repeat protein
VLNECASVVALEEGRHAHVQITWSGYDSHIFVSNSIVDIYAKWGSIEDAWRVFNKIPSCGVVSFNVMILAHVVECGQEQNALELLQKNATGSCAAKSYHFCGGHQMHVPV